MKLSPPDLASPADPVRADLEIPFVVVHVGPSLLICRARRGGGLSTIYEGNPERSNPYDDPVSPRRWHRMSATDEERVLVLALPARHLAAAADACRERGWSVLPAGGPGDLDATAPGTRVLVIVSDDLERMPGATWEARFEGRVLPRAPTAFPDGVPTTWVSERAVAPVAVDADQSRDPERRRRRRGGGPARKRSYGCASWRRSRASDGSTRTSSCPSSAAKAERSCRARRG